MSICLRTWLSVILTAVLLSGYSLPQAASPPQDEQVNQLAERLAKNTHAFLTGGSSKPGITVQFQEVSRKHVQGRLAVSYNAIVHGAPSNAVFTALAWPINQQEPQPILEGVTISAQGVAVCAGRKPEQCGSADKPDDPVNFAFFPAPGEPVRIALTSESDEITLMFGAVPDTVVKSDGACSIEAVRLLPKWEAAFVRVKGLAPEQALRFHSDSSGEIKENDGKSSAAGTYLAVLLPGVQGKSSGKTTVKVTSQTCSPSLSFDWGKL